MSKHLEIQLDAPGGHEVPVYLWEPAGEPSAVIQIFHGLGEHSARYGRFADSATRAGFVVCAHDHRGHGPRAETIGFFAPRDGWNKLIADGKLVNDFLGGQYRGKPVVLLGHSMGSYIAQSYAMRHGGELAALALSGSTWPSRMLVGVGRLLARFEAWRLGKKGESALLNKLGFGDFNRKFEPARTELDWLSRDQDEVDRYVADPLCGGPYSTGLWLDLLGGLLEVSKNANLGKIPPDLPILITGGADDPVGGESGMLKLVSHYQSTGHATLSETIYADGRHEMFNEINRDEFTSDLLDWIASTLAQQDVGRA